VSGPAIAASALARRYGRTEALRDVSFTVQAGEVVGFVGRNGAGKSTALRILTGFLDPDAGEVAIAGLDMARQRKQAQARIGYMPESVPLYHDMRVDEYLRFRARLKGVGRREVAARLDAALALCDLGEVRRRLIGQLSRGFRQRVGLADAWIADPPILILDEPTAGLDPVQTRAFRALLGRLGEDRSVLVSSHDLGDIEAVADRVVVLAAGRVVGDGTAAALRARLGLPAESTLEDVFVALTAAAPAAAPAAGAAGEVGAGGAAGAGRQGEDAP
jgi:ABC-2 type transport system ATP-binding protein